MPVLEPTARVVLADPEFPWAAVRQPVTMGEAALVPHADAARDARSSLRAWLMRLFRDIHRINRAVTAPTELPSRRILRARSAGTLRNAVGKHLATDVVSGVAIPRSGPRSSPRCRSAEVLDGANAGRRGDVDLGEVAVDHVDADEQGPRSRRARRGGRESRARARSARSPWVRRRAILERRSSGAGTRFTAPANAPSTRMMRLSSRTAGRRFLHHPRLAEGGGKQVVERAEIGPRARAEHGFAPFAVERLHHDVAVLGAERLDLGEIGA